MLMLSPKPRIHVHKYKSHGPSLFQRARWIPCVFDTYKWKFISSQWVSAHLFPRSKTEGWTDLSLLEHNFRLIFDLPKVVRSEIERVLGQVIEGWARFQMNNFGYDYQYEWTLRVPVYLRSFDVTESLS